MPNVPDWPPPVASPDLRPSMSLEEARERTAQSLCLHFAADHLAMDVLEDRLTRVYRAQSILDLQRLTSDLPAVPAEQFDQGPGAQIAAPGAVQERGFIAALLGGHSRKGTWYVPRHLKVYAFMGGAQLDLREAVFAPGVTQIECYAVFGGIDITVPPGVRVDVAGAAIMGGFDTDAGDPGVPGENQPIIRITGMAMLGGVSSRSKRLSPKLLKRLEKAEQVAGRLRPPGR